MQNALDGIRVLDLTMNLPGPYMTWLLSEMGAEVLKVENPVGGDFARAFMDPETDHYLPVFDLVNRGKKSLSLDLKHPEGREIFITLLDHFDIVVEGFRPGVMKKLHLDFETIHASHPNVIYVSISGYGQDGPYAQKGGHDLNYQALAGCFDTGGSKERAPSVPRVPLADLAGGSLFALSGLLSAIIRRQRTGNGRHVDVSLFDGAFALSVVGFCNMLAGQGKPNHGDHALAGAQPFYNLYRTKDGRYMSLGAVEPKFWHSFCRAVGREDLVPKQFGGTPIIEEVADIFRGRTQHEWVELFRTVDTCCEPVLSLREVVQSDLCQSRRLTGKGTDGGLTFTSPFSSSATQCGDVPAPQLGQHNREVLSLLRISERDMEELTRQGVISR
mgnify:CR=1 FL=1